MVGFAGALGIGLGACSKVVDTSPLERSIKEKIEGIDIVVTSVDCPDRRDAKSGDTFQCTATTDGGVAITVQVTQKDDNGSLGFDVGRQVFSTEKVDPEIRRMLEVQGNATIDVTCPKGVVTDDGKGTVACTATADGYGYDITVPIADAVAQLADMVITETAAPPGTTPGSTAPPESTPPGSTPDSTAPA